MFATIRSPLAWLCFALISLSAPAWATPVIGAIATEPDVPIAGQEDIVIFNLTGPADGCSTPSGTPICTVVTFNNVSITINGTDILDLGDIAPGMTETYPISGGVFADDSITSLALSATLSVTSLVDDLGTSYTVDPDISLSGLPVDGSFEDITPALAPPASVPEPSCVAVGGLFSLGCVLFARVRRKKPPTQRPASSYF